MDLASPALSGTSVYANGLSDTSITKVIFGNNLNKSFFRWAIPVVFDVITSSRQRIQTQLVHILFITKCSFIKFYSIHMIQYIKK